MASNSFGTLFRITTFGESHGKTIGVVIDGCPAGIPLVDEDINSALARRAPGQSPYTSPRKERDQVDILSGLFEGKTTGAPLAMLVPNTNADSSKYIGMQNLLRPGHANFTYLAKYGVFDYRGGGRSSARETAARVAAGAVAKKLLSLHGVEVLACLVEVEQEQAEIDLYDPDLARKTNESILFCPDPKASKRIQVAVVSALNEGDSVGGIVQYIVHGAPAGWGDPVYNKLEAQLAQAMLSIPACKGFEIGSGFASARLRGSQHNDSFSCEEGAIYTRTNQAGGVLGGITTGSPIWGRVAFKPTSSIRIPQETVDLNGKQQVFSIPEGSRHDPCVAIRAVPVVEAMTALVLADALLLQQTSRVAASCTYQDSTKSADLL